jgi:hypothetical protein
VNALADALSVRGPSSGTRIGIISLTFYVLRRQGRWGRRTALDAPARDRARGTGAAENGESAMVARRLSSCDIRTAGLVITQRHALSRRLAAGGAMAVARLRQQQRPERAGLLVAERVRLRRAAHRLGGSRGERLPRTTVRLCGVLPEALDLSVPKHVAICQNRDGAKLTKMVGHLLRGCHGLDRHRVERGPGRRRQRDAAGRVGPRVLRRLRQLSVCRFPPTVLRGPVARLFQPWRPRAWSCVRCHAVSLPARRSTDARCGRRTRLVRVLRPRRLHTDGFRAASRFLTIEVRRPFHQ